MFVLFYFNMFHLEKIFFSLRYNEIFISFVLIELSLIDYFLDCCKFVHLHAYTLINRLLLRGSVYILQVYKWVRFAIGYVFITSGIVKLLVPSFQEVFANLGIPYANISLFLLAMIEIICGTLIIVNMYVKYVTVALTVIMVGAIIIAKLPVLFQEGILSFLFESRLDVTMLILLVILWRKHDFEEKLQYTK